MDSQASILHSINLRQYCLKLMKSVRQFILKNKATCQLNNKKIGKTIVKNG